MPLPLIVPTALAALAAALGASRLASPPDDRRTRHPRGPATSRTTPAVNTDGSVRYTDEGRGYLGARPRERQGAEWRSPPPDPGAYGIAIGTDGRAWYNEARSGLMVAFDPKTEKRETAAISTGDGDAIVRHMEIDSARRRIWLALSGTGRLGRIELRR